MNSWFAALVSKYRRFGHTSQQSGMLRWKDCSFEVTVDATKLHHLNTILEFECATDVTKAPTTYWQIGMK